MKQKLTLILLLILFSFSINAQSLIHTVDFETATGYTTSVAEFTDGSGDYFIRTDGSDIGSWMEFTGIQGTSFFGAQDTDGDGGPDYLTLDITGINISGYSSLELRIYLAEDDDGTNEDWDDDTYLHISGSVDGGASENLIWVEAEGGTNSLPRIDTDFDGVGDGTEITPDFVQFTANISGTGSLLDILVEFDMLDAGDEDIAIDHIEIYGTGGASSGGATCALSVPVTEGTHHAIHTEEGTGANYDQWYTFEATVSGTATVENCASDVDIYFLIQQITCGNDYDMADDDVCGTNGYSEDFTFDITAGITYFIGIGNWDQAATAEYDWTLTETSGSTDEVDWCNLQWPDAGTIDEGDDYNVYAQVYEAGITDPGGQGAGITGWIGYSTTDTDPSTWTDWVPATYNTDVGNNDEYMANIGTVLPAGDFYYASRFQLNGGPYSYGGYNAGGGGFWDGTTNVSGTVTVNAENHLLMAAGIEDGVAVIHEFDVLTPVVNDYVLNPGNITFAGYSILDPTDLTVFALITPSATIIGNAILDTMVYIPLEDSVEFYAGILPIPLVNTVNSETIMTGFNASFNAVVTANDEFNQFWIQDDFGSMHGVLVYSSTYVDSVVVGDSIFIIAERDVYSGMTELVDILHLEVFTSGNSVYSSIIDNAHLDYYLPQDDPNAEPWEGQLVTVSNLIIDSLAANYEYFGHDCDGNIICIDDDVDYHYESGLVLNTGTMYDITGVVTYAYGNYKVNPRGTGDATEIPRDLTSVVEDPDTQTPGGILDGTLVIDSLHAVEIIKFKVTDEGTDGLPTKISQMTIYAGPDNTIDFTGDDIAGGWLDFGDAAYPIVITEEPTPTAGQITFLVDPETAIIDNGTSDEIIVHLWFDPAVVDESVIQFMVQADPHGFIADCMNSQFAGTFANDITGGAYTIDQDISVEDIANQSIKVYPNPAADVLYVKNMSNISEISIVNILGKTVQNINVNEENTEINISNLTNGMYFIEFNNTDGSKSIRNFVKN